MQIIRFESTLENSFDSFNKIIIFNRDLVELKEYDIQPQKINSLEDAKRVLMNLNINHKESKIIINDIVKNSYSFPFKVFLDITDDCQLNCKHCLTKQLNIHQKLSMNQIDGIIKECEEHGAFFVKLGGGEPLLHPDIKKIIKKFSDIGMLVSLSTNGYLINDDMALFLCENRVKVSISLEGPREVDEYIRGKGHYDVALKALEILKNNGVTCVIRTTLTKNMLNINMINEMIFLAKSNNVKLKISYCRPAGNAIDNQLLIDYKDYNEYVKVIEYINRKEFADIIIMDEGMQLVQDSNLSKILYNDKICGAANRSMHINTAGKISPCVFLGKEYIEDDSSYEYGDILDYWSEKKGIKLKAIRDVIIASQCTNCDRFCKNECLSTRLYFTGDFKLNDPNCLGGFVKCRKLK